MLSAAESTSRPDAIVRDADVPFPPSFSKVKKLKSLFCDLYESLFALAMFFRDESGGTRLATVSSIPQHYPRKEYRYEST
jgi:hypothetical protein